VRPRDRGRARQLDAQLRAFARYRPLPGIRPPAHRRAFLEQLIESIRRIEYITLICGRPISPLRADPSSELFDPLKAAVLHHRQGNIDEAFWLVFVSVYFGKNRRTGWRLARDVYGGLGTGVWHWARISHSPSGFRAWLEAHQTTLRGGDGIPRRFGNHRKHESLDASSSKGCVAAFESYVRWVTPPRTHQELFEGALRQVSRNHRQAFDRLYRSMEVASFGRTARFDYLTMIGKLGLAPIEPGATYMHGATGPLIGARLLFGGRKSARLAPSDLEACLVKLEARLHLGTHGMQVLEDALCNWQKSPSTFAPFRG
jgi:hypothetical protein